MVNDPHFTCYDRILVGVRAISHGKPSLFYSSTIGFGGVFDISLPCLIFRPCALPVNRGSVSRRWQLNEIIGSFV